MELKQMAKLDRVKSEEEIVICKLCGRPEFWSDMRWLNGKCMCRECDKSEYEDFYGKYYKWDDLNGTRPTREAYERQEKMKQRFKEIDEFFDSLSNEEFEEMVKECMPEGEVRSWFQNYHSDATNAEKNLF